MEFTPQNAPVVLLGFLFTCALLAAGTLALLLALRGGRRRATRILEGMGVIALLYTIALLAFSLSSRDTVLEAGQRKYFCEIDCHLAYSVIRVATPRTLGSPARPRGIYYVVTVKTWFDERTIGPRRRNRPLRPNPRRVLLVDERGRVFPVDPAGMKAQGGGSAREPFTQPLRPGESYTTNLVFDLPPEIRSPRLLITEDNPVAGFLIGHENSFLHKKIWFRLQPVPAPQALRGSCRTAAGCSRETA